MATREGRDLARQVPGSRWGGESRLGRERRSPRRPYWPFKGLRPARPQGAPIGPESGRAQPNLTHPPAAFPVHLPRGPAAAPANRRPARQPSSAWPRPRESLHPIGRLAEAALACRGRGERQGRARGGWLERRSSREVRESFFGGENSRGTRGPARGRGRGGPGTGEGPLPDRGRVGPALPGGDRPTKDPWGARPRGPPRPWIRPPQTPRARHSGIPRRPGPSAARAPLTRPRVCLPGGAGSGHVPRLQAARRGRRVSATPLPQPTRVCSPAPALPVGARRPSPLAPRPRVLTPPTAGQDLPARPQLPAPVPPGGLSRPPPPCFRPGPRIVTPAEPCSRAPGPRPLCASSAVGMDVRAAVTLASRGSRPAGGKAPGPHGGFVVAVKQERGEGPRAGEKGSHEEEVSPCAVVGAALGLAPRLEAPPRAGFELAAAPPAVLIFLPELRPRPVPRATPPEVRGLGAQAPPTAKCPVGGTFPSSRGAFLRREATPTPGATPTRRRWAQPGSLCPAPGIARDLRSVTRAAGVPRNPPSPSSGP